ncbi:protein shifted isoform X1 [Pogonomyrmex barbatus]|uniref:Protein shifted isoform X1 n=1 Tax=Pogonomyrmex barbatus TaxID=144034 RepID=A0A6I9VRF2_9HYME|nr:protein shifted isoform X1 [Pogonomyrmex barbatus]
MRSAAAVLAAAAALALLLDTVLARHQHRSGNPTGPRASGDISLWIDQQQIKMFSGLAMEIYAIAEGKVLSYLLDPEFENKLPIIPSEVSHVNFTWKSGVKKYFYNFFHLKSFDESILKTPSITIKTQGRVPKRPKEFSILLPCAGNSGIAQFGIGLMIESRKGKPLNGTPLRLRLRKECTVRGICVEKCLNGGKCIQKDVCECPKGYFGLRCEFSKCVIPCLNGGKCKGNNICRCLNGYKGNHCEIGTRITSQRSTSCSRPCRHGTCQGDTCLCEKGWYGKFCHKNKPWA